MSYYVRKVASLVSSSLRFQSRQLVSSIYPRINVLGLVGMPAALLLLSLGTVLWILVFFLAPMLLICVWMVLAPWRLWLYLKSLTIGKHFSG
jgi:hypothetical protein